MRLHRAHIAAMCRGDKDRTTGVSSLTNEEPLVVVKSGINVVGEVVGEDRGYGRDGVVRERETALRAGGCGSVHQWLSGVEDGYIGRGWGVCGHRGSKVFTVWGSDKDVVGVDGDVLMEWSKEESIEDFLGDLRGSGRHGE